MKAQAGVTLVKQDVALGDAQFPGAARNALDFFRQHAGEQGQASE